MALGMAPKVGRQSKILLKENGLVSFHSKDNANTFCRFFSNLAYSLLQKLSHPKLNLESKLLNKGTLPF